MKISSFPILSKPETTLLPLFGVAVAAGFPSPADDFIETPLDIREHLVKHPSATFLLGLKGTR